jgi:hypothetical protein
MGAAWERHDMCELPFMGFEEGEKWRFAARDRGVEDDGCDHSCVTLLTILIAAYGGWQLQKTLLC